MSHVFEAEDEANWIDPDAHVPVVQPNEKPAKRAKTGGRKKATPLDGKAPPGMVVLTSEQIGKLWTVITGGRIVLDVNDGQPVAYVSYESLKRALPELLARL